MITATATLRHEHEAILHMLDATEEIASQLKKGNQVPPDTISGLVEFFKLFADRCHHGKEEDALFPELERKGMPRGGGPIAVMLYEHNQGRALIRQMAEAAENFTTSADAGPRWADAAAQYASLLRAHIDKENNILFVMAERLLTDAEQQELAEQFEKIEVEKMGAGTHERLHKLMERILHDTFQHAPAH